MNDKKHAAAKDFSVEELELLEYLLEEDTTASASTKDIPRRKDIDSALPSFAQQRLWFLDQLEPGLPVFAIAICYRLHGPLDVEALTQSLNEIVRRHEALRTTFSTVDGQPVQVIASTLTLTLPVVDLRGLPKNQRETEARRLARKERRQPFDLAQGPLLRTTLLRLDEEEHVLVLTMHHIISDGWSIGILRRELSVLYEAYCAGKPSPLPDLPIQYADYAVWQREWLQGEVLEEQLAYWGKQLEGAPPVLELPADHPRPRLQTYEGTSLPVVLTTTLSEALRRLSRQQGVTLFMTLLAAFETLLYRYSGQDDISVGSPIANRRRAEVEGLIGLFMNNLVLRSDLSGNPTFRELLGRVREVALGAYAHQDLPFEKLVEALQPERVLNYNPLFQVMFILQNVPAEPLELTGLTASFFEVDRGIARQDLILELFDLPEGLGPEAQPKGLQGSLEYNTNLFDTARIKRMVGHLQTLLEGIVADPETPISELPLLTEAEQHQLLVEWNDTRADYARDKSLVQLFEEQVKRSPDATAFVYEDQALSYRELNQRANRLARYLQLLGVGPEVPVGICLERSLEMAVGLMAVLKAGAAFLPLDPSDPQARLAFILDDAGVPVILTRSELAATLPDHQAKAVCLDAAAELIAGQDSENLETAVFPEHLAYLIYTSGSTGEPKGVAVPHDQILNRFAWMWDAYPFEAGEVGCQRSGSTFVDSIWELLGNLLQGVPTAIIPDPVVRDPQALVHALAQHQVSRIWVVPSLLRVLLDTFPDLEQRLPKLRFWVSSGEALPKELDQRFGAAMPQATLYNLYGTSEVWDATWYVPEPEHPPGMEVPIGSPIANMQTYILDANLEPLPIGVPGELHISGVGVARGYLNRPGMTAERFIPDPFRNDRGARLYKTGDLARYLPDGNIEFLGRLDHQVKIRGFRIELGEIETVLVQHPALRVAVVLAREDLPGDKRLVAYVVPEGEPTTTTELRHFLQQRLPEYMLPAAFVMLDALPLTASRKVDRRALPAPDWARPELEQAFVAPRTPVEEALAGIWSQILGVERVGIHDDFFELGGHSLLATRVMARVRDDFRMALSLRSLFEAPTVAGLASLIEIGQWSAQNASDQPQGAEEEFEEGQL
jgi:amino acid adenylation domain-containing protein